MNLGGPYNEAVAEGAGAASRATVAEVSGVRRGGGFGALRPRRKQVDTADGDAWSSCSTMWIEC
jgi:hypothetical protein